MASDRTNWRADGMKRGGTCSSVYTYRCGEVCELEPPVLLLDGVVPEDFRALLAIALFSSRKTRSKSSGYPGHTRADFLQLPHIGLFSSHCAWLAGEPRFGSQLLVSRYRDQHHQVNERSNSREAPTHTFIRRLLHMPHPRLGLPV